MRSFKASLEFGRTLSNDQTESALTTIMRSPSKLDAALRNQFALPTQQVNMWSINLLMLSSSYKVTDCPPALPWQAVETDSVPIIAATESHQPIVALNTKQPELCAGGLVLRR